MTCSCLGVLYTDVGSTGGAVGTGAGSEIYLYVFYTDLERKKFWSFLELNRKKMCKSLITWNITKSLFVDTLSTNSTVCSKLDKKFKILFM